LTREGKSFNTQSLSGQDSKTPEKTFTKLLKKIDFQTDMKPSQSPNPNKSQR